MAVQRQWSGVQYSWIEKRITVEWDRVPLSGESQQIRTSISAMYRIVSWEPRICVFFSEKQTKENTVPSMDWISIELDAAAWETILQSVEKVRRSSWLEQSKHSTTNYLYHELVTFLPFSVLFTSDKGQKIKKSIGEETSKTRNKVSARRTQAQRRQSHH